MKKSIQRILSIVMTLIICLSLTISSFANQTASAKRTAEINEIVSTIDCNSEIQDALDGIIDVSVPKEILNSVEVSTNENRNVSYTIKNLGSVSSSNSRSTPAQVYSVTAASEQKVTTSQDEQQEVVLWITMVWIDNLGILNELVRVSGGWTPFGHTITGRAVYYGVADMIGSITDEYTEKLPKANSYSYETSYTGIKFVAYSFASVDSNLEQIGVSVESTIYN